VFADAWPWSNEMLFSDRRDAGVRLAEALEPLRGRDLVVLGIPRGGVEVAAVAADALAVPLDVVIPRKLGAPGNPELGLGAVAEGVEVLDERLIRLLGVEPAYIRGEIAAQQEEIARRSTAYRQGRDPVDVAGKTAVVIDDGIATGGTAVAAVRWARAKGAKEVILAVPVAPRDGAERLRAEADDIIVLATPEPFYAVGQWYHTFPQVSDDEVISLLSARAPGRKE
jgi:putative phosphoribosyl transferase